MGKAELKRRVRMVVQTKKAKYTCRRMLRSLVKTAQIVIKKKGAAWGRWADRLQIVGLGGDKNCTGQFSAPISRANACCGAW